MSVCSVQSNSFFFCISCFFHTKDSLHFSRCPLFSLALSRSLPLSHVIPLSLLVFIGLSIAASLRLASSTPRLQCHYPSQEKENTTCPASFVLLVSCPLTLKTLSLTSTTYMDVNDVASSVLSSFFFLFQVLSWLLLLLSILLSKTNCC